MGNRRDSGTEEQEERSDRRDEERPQRRGFSGTTKIFDNRNKRTIVVEFSPDTTEQMKDLDRLVSDQRDSPSVDRCIMLCQEAGIRARVLVGGQYIGHIYDDGTCDRGVQNLL